MKKRILLFVGLALAAAMATANAATMVPPGNRNSVQPDIPGASSRRTQATNTSFQAKYRKVYALLQNDAELRAKIRKVAAAYDIDPMHIVGAIVGEHTYNVDAYDRLQTYYVKAMSYLSSKLTFAYEGEDVSDFVERPQFQKCAGITDSYDLWECREQVWNHSFRGKTVGGTSFPNDRFGATFFQPYYAGQTFGLGQLNPLTALQMSDLVHKVSGLPELDVNDPNTVYNTIMDPDLTLPYVAATIRKSIDAYNSIAGFDISHNPGLTATLYNVGNPEQRAYALEEENEKRRAAGEAEKLPEENYYGWLVNDKLDELKTLF
ncbi:DUF1402 family protein [Mesorhizobium sp. M1A.F.Ca.IN.022.07.1.1]|uniref:DUF1402 family protein n=3 Tax=Mesorhizobium TaxID=68287 RepID=UPI000F754440|nr:MULTISPECIES: DUF1402 family protein [unclassified Mesorhizobium]WIE92097.1 DUF1402 family protein [Mesorhizobium sp. WSM4875]AZO60261.1 DUF1402 family protein [Mesorhizobium sp. M1A.F.Ca.IN.022.06.1.1]MCT2576209.1 DUF1402 family protein [Mesorhizobium sp. P13.3]MDF3164859.1 DUF1402 family protein [Mesorhizobium sp. P16.1]MDF3176492.1 DUF1402 family protein [Mesorhizobium sp. P17.1]